MMIITLRNKAFQLRTKKIISGLIIFIFVLGVFATDVMAAVVFTDDFETDLTKWNGNGATAWDLSTAQEHAGAQSVQASNGNEGDIITDDIDTSDAADVTVSFWYRDDDLDSSDIDVYFFDGTNYDVQSDTLESQTEDAWHFVQFDISDSQYFKSNFRVRFNAVLGSGETFWVDDFLVEKTVASNTTLGDGTDPGNSTIGPGASVTDIDAFTLTTSAGGDTVTALTVTLGPANAFNNIAKAEITDGSNVDECTDIDNPASNTLNFTGCSLAVTTSPTSFKVRITPKTHANMPAPNGASYATVATVTSITATNSTNGTDTDSATVTVDNLSPAAATSVSGSAGIIANTINWTTSSGENSTSTVLRWASGSVGADVPVEGATYVAGNTISGATVACVFVNQSASTALSKIDGSGGDSGCTTSALTGGQQYSYRVFQQDSRGNYNTGTTIGTFTPTAITTTLGNGTNPSGATIAPGESATMSGAFTLQINQGTDTVTAITLSLGSSVFSGVSLIEITNDDGSVVYGSSSDPANDTPTVALSSNITVTTSPTQYKIRVTPKSHANMSAPDGATYTLNTLVTALALTFSVTGSDSGGSAIVIDNNSPDSVSDSTAASGDEIVTLDWENPADSDFDVVVVLRRAGSSVSDVPTEGASYGAGEALGDSVVACVTNTTTCVDDDDGNGLLNGTAYHYKIFARDDNGNFSETGVVPTGSPATPTAGVPDLQILHYRWFRDNGILGQGPPAASEDTAITSSFGKGDRRRLRFVISNEGNGPANGYTYTLEHSSSSCVAWMPVPTIALNNEHWIVSLTDDISSASVTANSSNMSDPPGQSFVSGYAMTSSNTTPAHNLGAGEWSEFLFSVRSTVHVTTGINYCFRLTNAGSTSNFTYTVTATANVPVSFIRPQAGGHGTFVPKGFIEALATPAAAVLGGDVEAPPPIEQMVEVAPKVSGGGAGGGGGGLE